MLDEVLYIEVANLWDLASHKLSRKTTLRTENKDGTSLKTHLGERDLLWEIHVDITWPRDMSISQTTSTTTNRPYAQLQKLVKLEQFKVGKAGFSL